MTSRGRPARWAGQWQPRTRRTLSVAGRGSDFTTEFTGGYDAGEIVITRSLAVVMSKIDDNRSDPDTAIGQRSWAFLGSGSMPTRASHSWHPQELQYPCGDAGQMSEPVAACSDCIRDGDYRNCFKAASHLFIIEEWGAGVI